MTQTLPPPLHSLTHNRTQSHAHAHAPADANADPATVPYPNEVRVEAFYPAYLTSNLPRPQLVGPFLRDWQYGQRIRINAFIPSGGAGRIKAALFTSM
jgi:hypothetical protein